MARKKPIRELLEALQIGEIKEYPLCRVNSVRTTISIKALETKKSYRANVDRKRKKVVVTRVK